MVGEVGRHRPSPTLPTYVYKYGSVSTSHKQGGDRHRENLHVNGLKVSAPFVAQRRALHSYISASTFREDT